MTGAVDIDLFIARNTPTWWRLTQLTRRARRTSRDPLTPAEVEELVSLYQRTSSHLSHARSAYRDPGLIMNLTALVTQANGVIYRSRSHPGQAVRDFFAWRFPAAVYQSRRFIVASAVLFLVPAIVVGVWLTGTDQALDIAMPEDMRQQYVEEDFEQYYSEYSQVSFTSLVFFNNARVGFTAFASGITLVLGGFVMVFNGANVGIAGAVMAADGEFGRFLSFIIPHGLLELTAIIVAGAAGLRMGWAIVAPGDRRRGEAFGTAARQGVAIALGLIPVFLVAAFIEGFITGRNVDVWLRVSIGVAAEVAFVTWIAVQGRRATLLGLTGEAGELERGWDELATARERAWAS